MTTIAARIRNGSLVSDERNSAALPEKVVATVSGSPISFCAFWIASTASPERTAGLQVERERDRRKLAFVNDGQRRGHGFQRGEGAQRHHLAGRGFDVDLFQRVRRELEVRLRFEDRRGIG